jgi:hypothetical protein
MRVLAVGVDASSGRLRLPPSARREKEKNACRPPQPTLPAIRKAVVAALAALRPTSARTAAGKSEDRSIKSAKVVLGRGDHLAI